MQFLDARGQVREEFITNEPMTIRIRYKAATRVERPVFGLALYSDKGVHINGPNTRLGGCDIPFVEGEGEVHYHIEHLPLLPGVYHLTVSVHDYNFIYTYDHHERLYSFRVQRGDVKEIYGIFYIPSQWRFLPYSPGR